MGLFKYLVYEKNTIGVELGIAKEPENHLVAGFMEPEQAEEYAEKRQNNSTNHITYYVKDVREER